MTDAWALGRIADALQRIADALEAAVAPETVSDEPATACLHPEEQRIAFGVTGGVVDWQCGACGYRTVTE